MSMFPAISIEIFRHWLMRLALARSDVGSRSSVVVISSSFTAVVREKFYELLVLVKYLLQNFCGSCCSGW